MAVTAYKHGVTWRDIPTSIVAPVTADSGIPCIVGSAPTHQVTNPPPPNRPRVYLTYADAVSELGYSDDWPSFTLCQAIYTYFALFNTGPIVCWYVNDASDPNFQGEPVADEELTFNRGVIRHMSRSIYVPSLVVKPAGDDEDAEAYEAGVDYVGAWGEDSEGASSYSISAVPGGKIPLVGDHPVVASYSTVDPSKVTKSHIIGGIDIETGATKGLEAVEDVFQLHGIVPGVLLAPFWTQDPEVAAVITAKADDVNGCFRCITLCDIDSSKVLKPIDVYDWKQRNNYTEGRMGALWPRSGIGDRDIWLSTQFGARIQKTDNDNANIPVETPSNKLLKMTRTLVGDFSGATPPKEVIYSKTYGDMLNGQGILTAINWIGGWKAWGSNMACYPFITDPKDRWMPARRMTDYVGNTLVLTIFQKVDRPTNRRLIDSVIDSVNVWLNSLVSSGNALGARVEFRHDENSDTSMIDGHYKFHVFQFFPLPAEWIEFLLELDISYLSVLFTPTTVAA